jgi:hypothetical protein
VEMSFYFFFWDFNKHFADLCCKQLHPLKILSVSSKNTKIIDLLVTIILYKTSLFIHSLSTHSLLLIHLWRVSSPW